MRKASAVLASLVPVLFLGVIGLAQAPDRTTVTAAGGHTPVVFVPGVTGTQLRDPATGSLVWGSSRELLRPRDGGYSIALPITAKGRGEGGSQPHPQAHFDAIGPIWRLELPGWTKEVYGPLRDRFAQAGYRLGDLAAPGPDDDLFFFDYDWRYGNLDSVKLLDRQLTALAAARGGIDVDLICQSNAAKICRWLVKYGSLDLDGAEAGSTWQRDYRVRKLILAGASNGGAMRVMKLLDQGRIYIPLIGRRFFPELFFTLRPLFEDLPSGRHDLFFDEEGNILEVDLFDVDSWVEHGWSIFGREAVERLRRGPRPDLFGDRQQQIDYLDAELRRSSRLQRLLARDSDQFPAVRYLRLENQSLPTIHRALLTRQDGEWQTFFLEDRQVDRDPRLTDLAAAPGDGHAVLSSQRDLSPQETAVLEGSLMLDGRHFEVIIQPRALDAMLDFLAAP